MTGTYHIFIDGEQKTEAQVNLGFLSNAKRKAIESGCGVKLTIDDQKGEINITAQNDRKTDKDTALKIFTTVLHDKNTTAITTKIIREQIKAFKEAANPRPKIIAPQRKQAKAAVPKTYQPKAEERQITTIDHTAFDRLLNLLSNDRRAQTLTFFEQDARIGLQVEILKDSKNNAAHGLKAFVPVLPNGASGDGRLELVRAVLKRACDDIASGSKTFTKAKLKNYLDQEITERQDKDAKEKLLLAKGKQASSFTTRVDVYSLNGKSVQDFAEYMVHKNRRSAFVAFRENQDINFEIKIKGDKGAPCHFEIIFDERNGDISMNDITLSQFLLAKLRMQHDQGRNINKEFVKEFLENTLSEIVDCYTEEMPGDKISTIFASMAAQERLSLSYKKPEKDNTSEDENTPEEKKSATSRSLSQDLNIASAVSAGEGNFKPPVHFDLAPWKQDEDGKLYLEHTNALGDQEKLYPTENQLEYIEALRNGDVRTVMLAGESGTGKTFWAVRIALEMLQQGVYKDFLYERSTAVVGTRQYNPYRKGGDTAIFSSVLEDEIATHLGMGNIEKGYEIFNTLGNVKMLKRYEQMYRRGDNLDGSFLLADEVQQKDDEEMFHLTTRPKDTAKAVLIGDYKRQNDLGDLSGFARMFNMFSNPDVTKEAVKRLSKMGRHINPALVSTIRFGVEDVKRSDYTAYVIMVNDIFDEMFGESEKPKDRKHVVDQGHPSDRYDNPPKIK